MIVGKNGIWYFSILLKYKHSQRTIYLKFTFPNKQFFHRKCGRWKIYKLGKVVATRATAAYHTDNKISDNS